MTKELKVKRLIDLGCPHSKETLMSMPERIIDNMVLVQEKQFERAVQEQAFEMA